MKVATSAYNTEKSAFTVRSQQTFLLIFPPLPFFSVFFWQLYADELFHLQKANPLKEERPTSDPSGNLPIVHLLNCSTERFTYELHSSSTSSRVLISPENRPNTQSSTAQLINHVLERCSLTALFSKSRSF